MRNYARRLYYVQRRYRLTMLGTVELVEQAIRAGDEDAYVTPRQLRRLKHKRGGGHRNDSPPARKDGRAMTNVFYDEARKMSPVVIDGTRVSDLARLEAGAPWALPGADVKGDIQQVSEGGSAWDRRDGFL
jgi:hypothetical protein